MKPTPNSPSSNSSSLLIFAYFFLSFWIPLPLFFNAAKGEFIWQTDFVVKFPVVPVPVGAIAASIIIITMYFEGAIKKQQFLFLQIRPLFFLFLFLIFPFCVYLYVYGSMSLARIVQVIMPVLAFSFFSICKDKKVIKSITLAPMLSFLFFITLHILYLVFVYGDIFKVSNIEFSFWMDRLIYQSLVTYPSVIVLYMSLAVYIMISNNYSRFFIIVAGLFIIIGYLDVLLAARRASVFGMAGILFSLIFVGLIPSILRGRIRKSLFNLFLFFLFLSPITIYTMITSPLWFRFWEVEKKGAWDGGRGVIYDRAVQLFSNSPLETFFGFGDVGRIGFHNYILDTLARVGILGIIVMMIASFVVIFSSARGGDVMTYWRRSTDSFKIAVIAISADIFIQTMVNSSVTQPFYLANLLLIFIILMSGEGLHVDWYAGRHNLNTKISKMYQK